MKKLFVAISLFTAFLGATFGHAKNTFSLSRSTIVNQLDTCEAILQDLQSSAKTAIPSAVFRQAKAIVIINQFEVGLLLGVKDGYAIAFVRRKDDQWSPPAFFNVGEGSLGLQVGAKAIKTVVVIVDDSTAHLLVKRRFNLGAEIKVAAGMHAVTTEAATKPIVGDTNAYVYLLQEGYYLGLSINTSYLTPDNIANHIFYNTSYTTSKILYSKKVKAPGEMLWLRDYITHLSNR